jgi:hypothetical protein
MLTALLLLLLLLAEVGGLTRNAAVWWSAWL